MRMSVGCRTAALLALLACNAVAGADAARPVTVDERALETELEAVLVEYVAGNGNATEFDEALLMMELGEDETLLEVDSEEDAPDEEGEGWPVRNGRSDSNRTVDDPEEMFRLTDMLPEIMQIEPFRTWANYGLKLRHGNRANEFTNMMIASICEVGPSGQPLPGRCVEKAAGEWRSYSSMVEGVLTNYSSMIMMVAEDISACAGAVAANESIDASIELVASVSDQNTLVPLLDEYIEMTPRAMKLDMEITDWPFCSEANSLQIKLDIGGGLWSWSPPDHLYIERETVVYTLDTVRGILGSLMSDTRRGIQMSMDRIMKDFDTNMIETMCSKMEDSRSGGRRADAGDDGMGEDPCWDEMREMKEMLVELVCIDAGNVTEADLDLAMMCHAPGGIFRDIHGWIKEQPVDEYLQAGIQMVQEIMGSPEAAAVVEKAEPVVGEVQDAVADFVAAVQNNFGIEVPQEVQNLFASDSGTGRLDRISSVVFGKRRLLEDDGNGIFAEQRNLHEETGDGLDVFGRCRNQARGTCDHMSDSKARAFGQIPGFGHLPSAGSLYGIPIRTVMDLNMVVPDFALLDSEHADVSVSSSEDNGVVSLMVTVPHFQHSVMYSVMGSFGEAKSVSEAAVAEALSRLVMEVATSQAELELESYQW